jgi:magnesium chelatase family protein
MQDSLRRCVKLPKAGQPFDPALADLDRVFHAEGHYEVHFADIRGQESVKRPMMVAAAGHHNLAMLGPPEAARPWR